MTKRLTGRAWRRLRAQVLAASDICHICGHAGSDAADHVVPLYLNGTHDPSNLRPAPHTKPCPTCGLKCNRVKGERPHADILRTSGSIQLP